MSKPYRPSNGSEGHIFIDQFCDRCWYDRNEDCPVLADSFLGQVPQWIQDDDHTNAQCTQFSATEPKEFPEDAKAQLKLFEEAT